MGKKGVENMIDEIKMYIENCKPMPLSQTKIQVQKQELLAMLDELELKLPAEIERCKKIMRNKEMILADARTRSDAIIAESVNEANRMIEQNEITRLANIRSDEILEHSTTARLLSFPNVMITSHQGFFTEEALRAIAETTLQNALDFEAGKETPNIVRA